MESTRLILSLLVSNESGVLTRISGLFARRGFNIDSLSVGETENPRVSRITIQAAGDEYVRSQIVHQLEKLHDVKTVELMDASQTVLRELLLVKVHANPETRGQVLDAVTVFRAKVIDLTPATMTMELTGEGTKLDAFITYLEPLGIIEVCRTGVTAIGRGGYVLKAKEEE
ncbi:MAG: acetolactate synthase small subunit [Candidatus Limiplasma sp.]|nr:acetolactate synthase small subunit [Candidatus Limiplasma sp.]MEA5144792.1 acetolactate synthase small subunit [Candidatus Limiplasma sp.]